MMKILIRLRRRRRKKRKVKEMNKKKEDEVKKKKKQQQQNKDMKSRGRSELSRHYICAKYFYIELQNAIYQHN